MEVGKIAPTKHDDTRIAIGKPANFSGVLVSDHNYRFYSEQVRLADMLSKQKCPPQKQCPECPDFMWTSFSSGIVVGLLTAIAVSVVQHR